MLDGSCVSFAASIRFDESVDECVMVCMQDGEEDRTPKNDLDVGVRWQCVEMLGPDVGSSEEFRFGKYRPGAYSLSTGLALKDKFGADGPINSIDGLFQYLRSQSNHERFKLANNQL